MKVMLDWKIIYTFYSRCGNRPGV